MSENYIEESNLKRKDEFIICAASHYDDGIVYPHQPKNVQTGIIIAGRRHHNCINTCQLLMGDKFNANKMNRASQGFLTSHDRFLNRKEAFKMALANNQIIHNFYDKTNQSQILVSEDLY